MTTASGPQRRSSIEKQIDAAVAGWITAGLVQETSWKGRPLLTTRLPAGRDIVFDPDKVERVLRFFLLLKQLIGRWAGQDFRLLDWQVRWIVAPVFGLVYRSTGLRVIRTLWVEIPRKNGKSTLCSGLALYLLMADREPGAQVYAAAGSRSQASLVFRPARDMAKGSPAIAKALGKGLQTHLLEHPKTGSLFRALAKDAGGQLHGLNVHGAIIDEVHVHKSPDTIDALETGVGSRSQPLVAFITTADDGADGTVYATKREYLDGLIAGTIEDRTFFGVVFSVDHTAEGFDPFADATLRAANPGNDITVMMDYLRAKAAEARQSPAQLNRYLRLHLNVRTKQTTRWIGLDDWDVCGQLVNPSEWKGRVARGGLDLSTASDLTAFVLKSGDLVHPMFWLPEEQVEELERRTSVPLSTWAKAGYLRLTEGNVVDYAQVRADILAEIERLGCSVASVGYDPWNASETVQQLEAAGLMMVPVRQGYATLSAPAKHLERLIRGSSPADPQLRHGGHPVLRWCADCVEMRSDLNGNIRPVKPDRVKSTKRIDGIVALIMAAREEMVGTEEETSWAASFFEATRAPVTA
jgi:phage terminase large subunit-like protein